MLMDEAFRLMEKVRGLVSLIVFILRFEKLILFEDLFVFWGLKHGVTDK